MVFDRVSLAEKPETDVLIWKLCGYREDSGGSAL